MKMKFFVPLMLVLVLLAGCTTIHSDSQKIHSFAGVSLGMSEHQVESVLGTGEYEYTSSGVKVYSYKGGDIYVGFLAGTVDIVAAWAGGYSVAGISIGDTFTSVKSKIGDPTAVITADDAYLAQWYNRNIDVWFTTANDAAYAIGIEDLE
jgi:hypothetical protein